MHVLLRDDTLEEPVDMWDVTGHSCPCTVVFVWPWLLSRQPGATSSLGNPGPWLQVPVGRWGREQVPFSVIPLDLLLLSLLEG